MSDDTLSRYGEAEAMARSTATSDLLLVSADLSSAAHSHPLAQAGPTSSVAFQVLFARAGMHRAWVQFQRSGKVMTAAFTIAVSERQRAATYSAERAHVAALDRTSTRVPRGSLTAERKR